MVFNVPDSDERITVDAETLPYKVIKVENIPITLKDGLKLFAHLWIPQDVYKGTSKLKLGTLVEYLPYRKNDFTSIRDSIRHPYYAGYGLASMRVDMRGCGDSDDVLHGEYLLQEQEDNLEIFDWIEKQPWSNGKIGQFGKSWGGFNGLQIAARNHPALKTIITICSTDDRYADDVHYRGGCMLASDMLWWASTMLAYNARPQDPINREGWKENWLKRLELEPNIVDWVKHQTRDEFWKHGSVCENYNDVKVPVLAVGGWKDGYTNAIFRMLDNLPNADCKAIVGPWVHEFPEVASPSPGMGYNQIAVSWFAKYLNTEDEITKHLKKLNVGDDFNIEKLPKLSAYIQDPCSIAESYYSRSGTWVGTDFNSANVKYKALPLDFSKLSLASKLKSPLSTKEISFSGLQEHGLLRGTWCPFGQAGDFAADQKIEDAKCLTFDSEPFSEDVNLLGTPKFTTILSSDSEIANISVRLVDLNPTTKENVLISWGILNLNRDIGTMEHPKNLEIGKKYKVSVPLDAVGYKIAKGHKIRISLSTTDWPSFWPLSKTTNLTIYEDENESLLLLPISNGVEVTFTYPPPEALAPVERDIMREDSRTRKVIYDTIENTWTIDDYSDEGERRIVSNGMEMGSWNKNIWFIKEGDPLSAYNQCDWELTLGRAKEDWHTKLVTTSKMHADEDNYYLYNKLVAFENGLQIFEKSWENTIARNFS